MSCARRPGTRRSTSSPARLAGLRETHGADSVAVFGGGGLTNEKAYQLGKFARVALGTSQIDYNGRWCMSSAASAANQAFGVDRGLPFPLADVEGTDVLVLVGSNLAETMPPAARHLDRLRERGGRVVVIDPRRTPTADRADLFLQPVPGTDLPHRARAAAPARRRRCGRRGVRRRPHHRLRRRTPVGRGLVARAGRAGVRRPDLGTARAGRPARRRGPRDRADRPRAPSSTARAPRPCSAGSTSRSRSACRARSTPATAASPARATARAVASTGRSPTSCPGYRMIDDPVAREHVARVWGVEPESLPGKGRSAYELLDSLGTDDGARALLVFGSNIVVSAPNATHVRERLESLDLLVVADIVMSETAAMADVVLPVTQWAEETGTMTNLEGRVILRERAVAPPDGVRSDLDVLAGLAERLGSPVPFATDPESIFAELGAASAGGKADYAGIDYDRIRERARGVLAVPDRRAPGDAADVRGLLRHTDGRARFVDVAHVGAAEQPCAEYPLHLTTGRVLAQYQSGAQTRRIRDLPDDGPFVELHPMLADRIGAVDGQPVVVTTRRGELKAPARVVATIRPDTLFVPFHWVGANRLTNDALDPSSRMPEFKVCAAAVRS